MVSTFEPLMLDGRGREVALPEFGGVEIADTHAHLDMLEDPALALARAAGAGVAFVATVADVTEDARRTYEQLPAWLEDAGQMLSAAGRHDLVPPRVRIILGAHPHNAKDFSAGAEVELRRLAADSRTCALGELGLDFHYDHSPRDVQRESFRRHLAIAHELALPICVHLREAHDDGAAILEECGVPEAGCILHCFNLGPDVAKRFLALGCHVSFAGPVTFKKAQEVREAAAMVPHGRLLTETDCPFMAPEPFRGRTNEPALVAFTAARIAEARGEEPSAFARHAYDAAIGILDRERT